MQTKPPSLPPLDELPELELPELALEPEAELPPEEEARPEEAELVAALDDELVAEWVPPPVEEARVPPLVLPAGFPVHANQTEVRATKVSAGTSILSCVQRRIRESP
jgi:hypothetical protein